MPYFRQLVSPVGYPRASAPIIGLGGNDESSAEIIARLDKENAIARTLETSEQASAPTDAELAQVQRQEAAAMRALEKEAKKQMLEAVAKQLAFEVAVNAIPGVGAVLSLVLGQITKKTGERYKRKAEEYVRNVQREIDTYKEQRTQRVNDVLGRVYDSEYRAAEAAAIALITNKVMAVQVDGMGGFGSWVRKVTRSVVKTLKDPTRLVTKPIEQIKSFVDDMTGKSSYNATVKAANEQRTKARAQIKSTTDAQIIEAQSETGRALMRSTIVNTLVQSPLFQRLGNLMLETRRARARAKKRKSLGKKLLLGVGVATAAVVAVKVL